MRTVNYMNYIVHLNTCRAGHLDWSTARIKTLLIQTPAKWVTLDADTGRGISEVK